MSVSPAPGERPGAEASVAPAADGREPRTERAPVVEPLRLPPPLEETLAAVLRGDAPGWPAGMDAAAEEAFVDATWRHGVQPLVAWRLRRSGAFDGWPARVQAALARGLREEAALEPIRLAEAARVLAALAEAGAPALIVKGAALAYTHYPEPYLRPRRDSDLLVRDRDLPVVHRTLTALGYRPGPGTAGRLVAHQRDWVGQDRHGVTHVFDIHWRLSNAQAFANLLAFDDLAARAVPVPPLGQAARAPAPADALLLAAIHRVAHHAHGGDLLWIVDVHLLAGRLDASEWRAVVTQAGRGGVASIALEALEGARRWCATPIPDEMVSVLASDHGRAAAIADAYRKGSPRQIDGLLLDLRALNGWCRRARLFREHAFPPPEYLLDAYGVSHRLLLPALYAHRLARGAWRWLTERRS